MVLQAGMSTSSKNWAWTPETEDQRVWRTSRVLVTGLPFSYSVYVSVS